VSTTIGETGTFSTGSFALYATGINSSSTYYIRSYAVNTIGTGYSLTRTVTYATVTRTNMVMYLDAGQTASYSGSGTTWTDISPLGTSHATVTNTAYSSANGGSFTFNGTTSFAYTNGTVSGTGNSAFSQTYGAWVSPNGTSGNLMVFTQSPSYPQSSWTSCHFAMSGSKFRGKVYPTGIVEAPTTYTNNQWYYVTYVFNASAGSQQLYVNGALVASSTGNSYGASGGNNYVSIGQITNGDGNTGWFTGRIAVLQIYTNRALTASEVAENYNADRGRFGL
jgi:hypothetical protein